MDIDVVSMLPEDPERELRNLRETLILFTQAIQSPAIMQKIQQEGNTINLSPLIQQILLRMKIKDTDIANYWLQFNLDDTMKSVSF